MISVSVKGSEKLQQRLLTSADRLHHAVIRRTLRLAIELETYVKTNKLSGQVLKVQTGNLRRSIHHSVGVEGSAVVGRVFSDGSVNYAHIHEYGGVTPPHDILPVKAEALHFMYHGKEVFAKIVHHPGSKIPERSYLRSALSDKAEHIKTELTAAVRESVR
jgi:phage gpG-like protein